MLFRKCTMFILKNDFLIIFWCLLYTKSSMLFTSLLKIIFDHCFRASSYWIVVMQNTMTRSLWLINTVHVISQGSHTLNYFLRLRPTFNFSPTPNDCLIFWIDQVLNPFTKPETSRSSHMHKLHYLSTTFLIHESIKNISYTQHSIKIVWFLLLTTIYETNYWIWFNEFSLY